MSYFKPRNLLLVAAFCLTLALLVVIALRYRPEGALQQVVKALPEGVDVSLEEIDYTHIENGKSRWRLVAQEVKRQSESKVLAVSSPHLYFFDDMGREEGELKAGRGEVSEDYRQVHLIDNVVLSNASGYTFYTDRLDYDRDTQIASTDAHVRLVSDDLDLEGKGMTLHVQKQRVLLRSAVKGKIVVD